MCTAFFWLGIQNHSIAGNLTSVASARRPAEVLKTNGVINVEQDLQTVYGSAKLT